MTADYSVWWKAFAARRRRRCACGRACTHRLAGACVSRLIYAAYEDPAGEGDVEAEVDQHVPKLAAHTDRPGVTGKKINK